MYELSDYRAAVKEDIRKLESASGRLQAQIKLLAMNKDYIDAQAMELGFLESNQGFIHLKGYSPYKKDMSKFALSETITEQNSPQNLLRGISLSVSAILLLLFYLFSMPEKKEQVLQDAN